jgi:hypothetical protein
VGSATGEPGNDRRLIEEDHGSNQLLWEGEQQDISFDLLWSWHLNMSTSEKTTHRFSRRHDNVADRNVCKQLVGTSMNTTAMIRPASSSAVPFNARHPFRCVQHSVWPQS